jgi:hypothetical protein
MLKALATVTLLATLAWPVLAQTGSGSGSTGGSAGGTPGGGGTGATSGATRAPGTTGGRSDVAPGSGGPTSGGAILPRDQRPSQQLQQGRGTADLHDNSATRGAGPTVGPTGIVTPGPASGSMGAGAPTGGADPRPLGPGTGARDRGVPDSSVYNPGVGGRQR